MRKLNCNLSFQKVLNLYEVFKTAPYSSLATILNRLRRMSHGQSIPRSACLTGRQGLSIVETNNLYRLQFPVGD